MIRPGELSLWINVRGVWEGCTFRGDLGLTLTLCDSMEDLGSIIESLAACLTGGNHSAAFDLGVEALGRLVSTGEIRDHNWESVGLYSLLLSALQFCWQHTSATASEDALWRTWEYCLVAPEFQEVVAAQSLTAGWVALLADRMVAYATQPGDAGTSRAAQLRAAKHCFHWAYRARVDLRADLRRVLGSKLLSLGSGRGRGRDGGTTRFHLATFLDVLRCIVAGVRADSPAWDDLRREVLHKLLLPLHAPSEMVEWRDQVPVLQHYHEALVRCLVQLVDKDRQVRTARRGGATEAATKTTTTVLVQAVQGLLRSWPEGFDANTPKEVLFLHETEALLDKADEAEVALFLPALLQRLGRAIGTDADNIRPAQRALQMFKSAGFLRALGSDLPAALDCLLPALFRGGQLSWNVTINKMTGLAMRKLRSLGQAEFASAANRLLAERPQAADETRAKRQKSTLSGPRCLGALPLPPTSSLLGVPPRGVPSSSDWRPRSGAPPPVTVTGVAPWAVNSVPRPGVPYAVMPPQSQAKFAPRIDRHGAGAKHEIDATRGGGEEGKGREEECGAAPRTGLEVVEAFIERCLPAQETGGALAEDWNQVQAAASPTLLPSLKFHDLVFGRTLGEGAFGVVRYARLIRRDRTQSAWPEYAVKSISAERLRALGYYASVEREMAVLQVLSHPGICRLVSAFRYTGSAYLVLEYAARGDLHSYVLSLGARGVGQLGTRFVVGEVCAALLSLHEQGLAFNDLKPENVLITELGHIKLADFGGCRAVTPAAVGALSASRDRLGCLRDGDWREDASPAAEGKQDVTTDWLGREVKSEGGKGEVEGEGGGEGRGEGKTDERLEGTPGYLPPEVLAGLAPPGLDADAWGLGCLTHFCLCGRPLYYGSRDEVLAQMAQEGTGRQAQVHFAGPASDADPLSRAFIDGLLSRDPRERMSVLDAAAHAFLLTGSPGQEVPLSPLRLHLGEPVPLPVGRATTGSAGDEEHLWARRQFSVLWAPMPHAYNLEGGHGDGETRSARPAGAPYCMDALEEEGAEAHGCFVEG